MKKIFALVAFLITLTSCVTKKQFTELSNKYDKLRKSNGSLVRENRNLLAEKNTLQGTYDKLKNDCDRISEKAKGLEQQLTASKNQYKKLQASYDDLANNSSSEIQSKVKENQKLLTNLEEKENKLLAEQAELEKLKTALKARSKRIEDLEQLIANKEAAMKELKNSISNALKGFEGKGLTVEHRNGKVYVSMENKLLFAPGSWRVGVQGKSAVQELAKVLVQNPSIEVLIEGHTDDDPYKKGGIIQDNWDLSVKRATAIVRILQTNEVSPKQLTAAGRSEYLPVADNDTTEGKSKNRRIEIVLSPNLDEITKLLN